MQKPTDPFNLLSSLKTVFMTIGAVLFIALASIMAVQAGSPEAAHSHNTQPELQVVARLKP